MAATLLRVRLTPRGGRDAVSRFEGGVLYARVAAPPVDGAANRALLVLLAQTLNVPKSRLQFHSGETARDKIIRIEGLTLTEVIARLHVEQ